MAHEVLMRPCDLLEICQDNIIPWHSEKLVEQQKDRHCPFPMALGELCCMAGLALWLDKGRETLAAQKLGSHQGCQVGESYWVKSPKGCDI